MAALPSPATVIQQAHLIPQVWMQQTQSCDHFQKETVWESWQVLSLPLADAGK